MNKRAILEELKGLTRVVLTVGVFSALLVAHGLSVFEAITYSSIALLVALIGIVIVLICFEHYVNKLWWFCRMVMRAFLGLPIILISFSLIGCAVDTPPLQAVNRNQFLNVNDVRWTTNAVGVTNYMGNHVAPLSARITPPEVSVSAASVVSAVPAGRAAFLLTWSNWPAAGVSNILQYGPVIDVWRIIPLGETNQTALSAPPERTFYRILPVLAGQPGVPSNVVKYPGDDVNTVYAQRLTDLSRMNDAAAWEDFSELARWTNTPSGHALYRLRIERQKSYAAP